jgi:tetratricopeptide (TPR) repeat protein
LDSGDLAATESDASMERRSRAHAHYAAGVLHDLNDETDLALQEFFKAAQGDPDDEVLILEVSRRFTQNKQPDKALQVLLPAAARPQASGALLARLGFVYTQLGQSAKAIEANRAAIKKLPRLLSGYQNLFLNYMQANQPDNALGLLDEAANLPDTGPEFQLGLAELYLTYSMQYPTQREVVRPKAVAVLDRTQQRPLRSSQSRFRLAEAYNSLGEKDKAVKAYLDLVKNPGDLPVWRDTARARLAEIYNRTNDRQGMIQQLEDVVRDDPANGPAYYVLGTIAYQDKRLTNAVEYLKKALLFGGQLDPQRFEQTHYDLALAQIGLNDNAGALSTLGDARKKFPGNFVLEYLSGIANSEQKNFSEAVTNFTAAEIIARAKDPDRLDHRFYFQAGAASERIGNRAQAEVYFEKCIALSTNFSPALNYLGYMWAEKGEKLEKARELIERALKVEPESAAYLDSMGWVLFKQNQPKEALEYIQKALKLIEEPDATLLDHLGDIYAALNQKDKAREAWSKSLSVEKNEAVQKKLDAPPAE